MTEQKRILIIGMLILWDIILNSIFANTSKTYEYELSETAKMYI